MTLDTDQTENPSTESTMTETMNRGTVDGQPEKNKPITDDHQTQSEHPMVVSKGVMHDLFELIARPLERGNGFRHLFLGDSGMGKTVANTQFVDWLRATKRVDLILTLDDKDSFAASYIGCERVNPADLRANPPMPNEVRSHIVFRGVAMTRKIGQGCNPNKLTQPT